MVLYSVQLMHTLVMKRKHSLALWHWSQSLERKVVAAWVFYVMQKRRKDERYNKAMERHRRRLITTGVRQWIKVCPPCMLVLCLNVNELYRSISLINIQSVSVHGPSSVELNSCTVQFRLIKVHGPKSFEYSFHDLISQMDVPESRTYILAFYFAHLIFVVRLSIAKIASLENFKPYSTGLKLINVQT